MGKNYALESRGSRDHTDNSAMRAAMGQHRWSKETEARADPFLEFSQLAAWEKLPQPVCGEIGDTMAFNVELIYDDYVAYCERVGCKPASYATWKLLTKS